jgi:dihydromonapterin reductase/dihydrofolate reductase
VGKRIGLALANALLDQGYPVIGTYRSEQPGLRDLKARGAVLLHCDFYDQAQLDEVLEQLRTRYPRLRAVIHNASDWLPDNANYARAEIINKMMQVHACAPYQLNLALADALKAEGKADIIHLTDYVVQKGSRKHIAYAASKAALDNMTLSFASLLAPGVKVNSIAPALLLFNEGDSQAYQQKTLAKALIGREGGEQEVINTVLYLFNSDYVTGR